MTNIDKLAIRSDLIALDCLRGSSTTTVNGFEILSGDNQK